MFWRKNESLPDLLNGYISLLDRAGANSPKVIKTLEDKEKIDELNKLENIVIPDQLRIFLTLIDGYDINKLTEIDSFEPELIWGQFPLSVKDIPDNYECCFACNDEETSDYWPIGFLPILWGGSGDYVTINCIKDSITYGAVYDMSEGVGCNMIANSISAFIKGASIELKKKLKVFENPDYSEICKPEKYLRNQRKIYGKTPYFNREGKMDTQIVDWK